jgi:HlyD family secretion protein
MGDPPLGHKPDNPLEPEGSFYSQLLSTEASPDNQKTKSSSSRQIDQLNHMLIVVSPPIWRAIAGLLLMIMLLLIWAFETHLPYYVEGRGIFMSYNGAITLQALKEGRVNAINLKSGDLVKKGELIAEIIDPLQQLSLQSTQEKIIKLTADLAQLRAEISRESEASKASTQKEIFAKEYTIQQRELDLQGEKEDLVKKEVLLAQGLIPASSVREQQSKIAQINIEIETLKAAIEGLKAGLIKGYRQEEIRELERQLISHQESKVMLETAEKAAQLLSPITGKILELFVAEGDRVTSGTDIVWLEQEISASNPLVVYSYFPIDRGKDLFKGQEVKIQTEADSLTGTIQTISQYPVSSAQLQRLFHSDPLKSYLTEGASAMLFAVVVPEVKLQEHTKRPNQDETEEGISTGTVCLLRAYVGNVRPIYYLLPMSRFKHLHVTE